MTASTHLFQAPKGTRDFYPDAMALRRHIERVWREVSTGHGFDEIDGPTFEHLDLYTVKSGPGIVSELFSFRRQGGDVDYALRPEFTPTLARMYASAARSLPQPTRWFSIPAHFRAERPQRGRLREFIQWNVDVLGDPTAAAEAEIIAVTVAVLERFGLTAREVRMKISHREVVAQILRHLGLDDAQLPAAFDLLDKRDRIEAAAFAERWTALGSTAAGLANFDRLTDCSRVEDLERVAGEVGIPDEAIAGMSAIAAELHARGLEAWTEVDLGIVRGLAYYTGTVFELHEITGRERAMGGGGRYDQLVELFGGPPTPAVGFAMGDVVVRLVLETHGRLAEAAAYRPAPDVFLINVRDDDDAFRRTLTDLRRAGLHVRHSARSTRNVGKLLGEAGRARARLAVILGRELDEGVVAVKDLSSGEQTATETATLLDDLRGRLGIEHPASPSGGESE